MAHGARMLTAHTVGTGCIMLGSLIAKSLVGPLPGSDRAPEGPAPAAAPDAERASPEAHPVKGAA
ncbi:MAG TPA: hypothetical protein VN914_06745 [Polyangia bacterium]|nr:hypothetical protein [Polyangia bacterium]